MVATLCLMTCALATAQPPGRAEWLLVPQCVRGQELVYTGTFVEESLNPGVQFQRTFKLDTTLLVIDTPPGKPAEVAVLTVLSLKAKQADAKANAPSSVRLEIAEVNAQGRVLGPNYPALAVPLEGPPTVEWGALVEAPKTKVGVQSTWEVAEPGRTPRTWGVQGTEIVNGVACVKIAGAQQSEDWDRPRADKTAWRRRDTVWLSPQLGVAYRVERVVERRDPARKDPTARTVLRYDLESRLTYPGKLLEDRAHEVRQTRKFWEDALPLLRDPNQHRQHLDQLLKRVALHLDNQPPTPYRKATLQIQKRIEAARRGETVPEAASAEPVALVPVVAPGQRVPDAVITNLLTHQSVRLHQLLGQPLLLIFYNPASPNGATVLRFAQTLAEKYQPGLAVVGLAVTDDTELVRKQHAELRLSFPILDGQGLHQTFHVDATPRLVLLDGEGVFRGGYTGWGGHTAGEVLEELQKWLPKR